MNKKVLIIGGVAGGASCAARLRRLDEKVEIIMFEKGEYISFANCGLPYHIGGTIEEREKLLVQTPEAMKARFNIDVRVKNEVIKIDTKNKSVKVKNEKGEYDESYDYLVLSPGAKPFVPKEASIESDKIFTLRTVPDTDRIVEFIKDKKPKNAVVIGGGYIGVEMAENLTEKGINVTLVEAAPHIMAPFDSDMITLGEKELEENGVKVILNNAVSEFYDEKDKLKLKFKNGEEVETDFVVLAIGVKPDTEFLKNTGIELAERGHIKVDSNLNTSVDGIYAAGDAVEVTDYVNGTKAYIPLAGPANKMGRIIADNISGIKSEYKGTLGTSIIKIFSLTGATTGNNERTLKRNNIPYKVIYAHPASHASYYPGGNPLTIKLIFNMEGDILGSQIFGYDGVDKRIDDIAAVIRLKGKVEDLIELELAYAPPYSSAKDPVNMAGYIAENVIFNKNEVILPEDIDKRDKEKTFILDVRTDLEFETGYIDGAYNIDVNEIRDRLDEIPKDKEIYVYCKVGLRGYIATRILLQNGFKVKNLTGGYETYTASKFVPKGFDNDSSFNKEVKEEVAITDYQVNRELDACGLCCPGPLMQVGNCMADMKDGEILKVKASDPGFFEDIKAWCKNTSNELLDITKNGGNIVAMIKKGTKVENQVLAKPLDNKTMVVFSGDLDKAIASFIIANGAASMGKKVTMFFTFWGLNILRKNEKVNVKKDFMGKMFGFMMPRGSKKLQLSNMNMGGMGAKMIRKLMKDKNVTSLEDLIKSAMDSNVEVVACQMSMDLMGITQDELIDGVKIGGVGYYLGEAEESNVNLFI
ncbi:MAG: FAD-dependent oxidoreductase [Clostridiaceae bacterium]